MKLRLPLRLEHRGVERLAWALAGPDHELERREVAFAGIERRAEQRLALPPRRLDATGQPLVEAKVVTAAVASKSCCSKQRTCCDSHTKSCCKSHPTPKSETKSDFVVAWRALACHGQSLHWLAAVPTLIAVPLDFLHELPLVEWLGPPPSETAGVISDLPAVPPPERA